MARFHVALEPGPLLAALVALAVPAGALTQLPGTVVGEQKVSQSVGNFGGTLANTDNFGRALAALGDLDGDCIGDLAVGAYQDDDGGSNRGAVWILALNNDGTLRGQQKISDTAGGFTGTLGNADAFGIAVAGVGDLDGDGVPDLLVGASRDDDGGTDRGAVWVLFLNANGTVKQHAKISSTSGNFGGALADGDGFGAAIAPLGDLDGDNVVDIAVGAFQDDDGGTNRGAVWVLLLNANGTVKGQQLISDTAGSFAGVLDNDDRFGFSLASVGDLDGDGNEELAVGADQDDDGGSSRGAVWILFLTDSGTVSSHAKISSDTGIALTNFDRFGSSVTGPGDIDGNGIPDLAVGAINDDDGGINRGAVWIFFLEADGSLTQPIGFQKISAAAGSFGGTLDPNDSFGFALSSLGDLDRDGFTDLVVGATGDDDGGSDRGAAWTLFLQAGTVAGVKIRNGSGINPVRLSTTKAPSLGRIWTATVDCTGFAPAQVFHIGRVAPTSGVMHRAGELLMDVNSGLLFTQVRLHAGGVVMFTHVVPADVQFCGWPGYSQAIIGGAPGPVLTNAVDFVIGR